MTPMLLSQAVMADETSSTQPATKPAETRPVIDGTESRQIKSGGGDTGFDGWFRTLVALVIVAALIFVLRFLIKRFTNRAGGPAGTQKVQLLGGAALSAKHRLYVVRFDGRVLLIGAGPEGLSKLAESKSQETPEDTDDPQPQEGNVESQS